MDYWLPIIVLFGAFFFMLALGVPIVYAIGLSTLASISTQLDFNSALSVVSQKLASGLDSFTLLAIPFFILSGNIMNHGGIARRLINFARILGGRLPGSLAHCNILANMLFGAISGSAVASAAAMGGVMHPQQVKEGYDPAFSTAVNVASAPTGLLIPPSNTLIVYSLVSGGTSIAALFPGGLCSGDFAGSGTDGNSRYYRCTSRLSKTRTSDFAPGWRCDMDGYPQYFPDCVNYGWRTKRYFYSNRSLRNCGNLYPFPCTGSLS